MLRSGDLCGSSTMLKRYLLLGLEGEKSRHGRRLADEHPHERERVAGQGAEAEGGELGGHAEVRERRDLPAEDAAAAEQPVDDPVLPAVEQAVDAAERRRVPADGAAGG